MAVIIPYAPDGRTPFTFQATVGGRSVFGTVFYNHYANRPYLQLKDQTGVIDYFPLVNSPDDFDINLAIVLPAGSLVYRRSTNSFEAT